MTMQYVRYPTTGGGGVSSLNGQTGALTLLAGTNISITPGVGSLTINATGSGFGDINNGGNAFGSNITIGTNDAFNLSFLTNGSSRFTVNQTDQLLSVNGGSSSLPAFSFSGAASVGMYLVSSNTGALAQGTNDYLQWGNSVTKIPNFPLQVTAGSASTASVNFGTTNTGLYGGASSIVSAIAGSDRFIVSNVLVRALNPLFLDSYIDEAQQSTPANPAAGHNRLYFKSDNNLYRLTSAGVESVFATGGGSGDINDGGNAFGSDITIGATDGFSTSLISNNVVGLTLDPANNTSLFGLLKLKDQSNAGFVVVQGSNGGLGDKTLTFTIDPIGSGVTLSMEGNLDVTGTATIVNANSGDITIGPFAAALDGNGLLLSGPFGQVLNLEQFDATHPGGVPPSGGGTTNFLRADGTWAAVSGSGVTTIGTIDGNGASADGLTISGVTLFAQSASATNPGLVNTTTQSFLGSKTFNGVNFGATTSLIKLNGPATSALAGAVTNGANDGTTSISGGSGIATGRNIILYGGTHATKAQFIEFARNGTVDFTMDGSGTATFTGNLTASNFSGSSSGTNTGNVSLTAVGATPNANAASLSGQILNLQPFDSTNPGVVTSSGGGTTNFLRADGTWATPPGSGGGVTTVGTIDSVTTSANGLVISGSSIFAQSATTLVPGLVNNGTQNWNGFKYFKGPIAIGETDGNYNSNIANGFFVAITGLIADPALSNGTERMGLFCCPKFGSSPSAHVISQQVGVELSNHPADVNIIEILPMIAGQFGTRTTGIISPDLSASGATNCASISDDFSYVGQFWIHQTSGTKNFFGGRVDSNVGFVGAFLSGKAGAGLDLLTDFGSTTAISMSSGADVSIATGNLSVSIAGKGLRVKEGSNAKQGLSTLVGGTVVVSNTSVTANSRIFLTAQNNSGVTGFLSISARTAGTSFTILSSSALDTSDVAWEMFEPA